MKGEQTQITNEVLPGDSMTKHVNEPNKIDRDQNEKDKEIQSWKYKEIELSKDKQIEKDKDAELPKDKEIELLKNKVIEGTVEVDGGKECSLGNIIK